MTYQDMIDDMREVVRDLVKEGKDINEVLDMPFHFLVDVIKDKKKRINIVDDDAAAERILDKM